MFFFNRRQEEIPSDPCDPGCIQSDSGQEEGSVALFDETIRKSQTQDSRLCQIHV